MLSIETSHREQSSPLRVSHVRVVGVTRETRREGNGFDFVFVFVGLSSLAVYV